ncbi:flagellar assembly protein FliW [Pseudodesulfovibrio senegalensis]|jgi:flagellar assembly factor FliW|uniref:Flagellar assembly factor FliW n=1 Tax=Pseudodesulfovibrio senegalensis TaxID=1721087 RepID=A0A6N6MZX5_9BACT|nr:flagellar assembly protein FliW [Pseudodesulfovibrio senegalensis]KAB1440255.1 flagellar assembly protein FliW [Pseudodesulfovibrio senegalensis]
MARERKQVIQTRLGEREISTDAIVYFPRGLVGLEDKREYVLLQVRDDSPFMLLQCVTDPGLGLLVADPYVFIKDYDVKLDKAEKKILKLSNIRQLAVLVTVTIPQDKPEDTTLNLSGPILVNTEERVGLQAPQIESGYPAWYRLSDKKE